jgi:hypothetical protein
VIDEPPWSSNHYLNPLQSQQHQHNLEGEVNAILTVK